MIFSSWSLCSRPYNALIRPNISDMSLTHGLPSIPSATVKVLFTSLIQELPNSSSCFQCLPFQLIPYHSVIVSLGLKQNQTQFGDVKPCLNTHSCQKDQMLAPLHDTQSIYSLVSGPLSGQDNLLVFILLNSGYIKLLDTLQMPFQAKRAYVHIVLLRLLPLLFLFQTQNWLNYPLCEDFTLTGLIEFY